MGFFALIMLIAGMGCGSGTAASAQQYTLDVEGTLSVVPSASISSSVGKDIPTPQVLIGTTLIEVTQDTADELGIRLLNFDVGPEVSVDPELRLGLTPGSTVLGIIFKACELGIPYGLSYIELDLVVSASSGVDFIETESTPLLEGGQLLHLGTFEASAEDNDRSRLPVLDDIPIINFLFQGQQHQAIVDSLIIILTPQIITDTEG